MSEVTRLGAKARRPRRDGGKQASKFEGRSVEETSSDDEPEDPTEVANQIAAATDCELILYNGPIDSAGFGKIIELVSSLNPDKNVYLGPRDIWRGCRAGVPHSPSNAGCL